MRLRLGKVLLSGGGLVLGGSLGYSAYHSDLDPNNVGAVRFGRAAVAVGKIGWDYKKSLFSRQLETEEYEEVKSSCHTRSAQRLLELCQLNGGVFIKVGQHIGALDYLLPTEYVETMRVLHSKAPEMPLKDIYQVIREELGKDPEELFAKFDSTPLGSASLAQVHRATLFSGEEVAVKVQHKYVKRHSFVDIWTCHVLVRIVKAVFPQFEFMWLAEEMRKNLPLELAFTQEGKNAEKVASIFVDTPWLTVPKIWWPLTTDRLLVMQFCPGGQIDNLQWIQAQNIDVYDVSRKIGEMYSRMIFDYGYVHCDPHPGNVLVQKSSSGDTNIVLLDHGLYTQLTNKFRYDYADFWSAIINRDVEAMKKAADELGVGQLYGLFACMVTARSWSSIQKGVDIAEKNSAESEEIKANAARYLKEITDVLAYVNRQMILIFKTNDLLRGIESSLGTKNTMSSFIQMSRSCLRVLQERSLISATSSFARWKVNLWARFAQFRITCYELFLHIYWSRLGSLLRLRGNL